MDKYVIAVSGGVDSVVLLNMIIDGKMTIESELLRPENIVVAHFDHGIRKESVVDRIFVEKLSKKYGLDFYYKREELGPEASEALARERRYEFLRAVLKDTNSKAIITAHHQDDLIETVAINLLRGTNRRGLSSLSSKEDVIRPMLEMTKDQILDYARSNNLAWREDETNSSLKYLRNRVRQKLSGLSEKDRRQIIKTISPVASLNDELDSEIGAIFDLFVRDNCIERKVFISFSYDISREFLAFWLKKSNLEYDKKLIEKLAINLKTGKLKSQFDINKKYIFVISDGMISMKARTPV